MPIKRWLTMEEPSWAKVRLSEDRFPGHLLLFGAQGHRPAPRAIDDVDPELLRDYEKLGIPLKEQEILAGVASRASRAIDEEAVYAHNVASMPCSTRSRWSPPSRKNLAKAGVIFCSISEAMREHPELVKKYLGSVVPVATTITRRSTPPCSPTARSSTSPRAFAARWSCRPTSASTRRTPASSSAR
jgi:Fe-S cluster assembly protein SufB